MPNMKDAEPGRNNFLVVGQAGAGKTSLFATIPGRKFVYAFDPNVRNTLQGLDIEYEEFLADELDMAAITMKTGVRDTAAKSFNPETYDNFQTDFQRRIDDHFFDDFDAVSFDGTSGLQNIAMDRMQYLNGRFGKVPEMTDNVATRETVVKVLRMATNLPCMVYINCHVDFDKDDKTGQMLWLLGLIGKARREVPMQCSEIWRAFSEPNDKDEPRWFVQTVADRYYPYLRKSRCLSHLPNVIDVTVEDWARPEEYGLGPIIKELLDG